MKTTIIRAFALAREGDERGDSLELATRMDSDRVINPLRNIPSSKHARNQFMFDFSKFVFLSAGGRTTLSLRSCGRAGISFLTDILTSVVSCQICFSASFSRA